MMGASQKDIGANLKEGLNSQICNNRSKKMSNKSNEL